MAYDSKREDLRTDPVTLTNDILSHQQLSNATGDLSILLTALASACKWISNVVRKAELLNVIGMTGATNVQNENVQKMDILSNQIMINLLRDSGRAAILVSEEEDEAIFIQGEKRNYCVCFDPLDGSSNIDCGVSIGTIFAIYHVKEAGKARISDVLRPGNELVAAGYCMYGSSTVLFLTFANYKEVNGYTLDNNIGEFILTHGNLKIGKKRIYSINEGNTHTFDPAIKNYLESVKFPAKGQTGKFTPYSARYVGSMVADVHRTILYGGVFMYPGAKLRVLYECFPMAMLVEHAGGKASTGRKRILDLAPGTLHERSAIVLGNIDEVEKIEEWYRKLDSGDLPAISASF